MIIFSGFPDLYMDALEIGTHDSNRDICRRNTSSSRSHRNLNVSNRTWRLTRNIAPLEIWIEIRTELSVQRKENEISLLCGRRGWARRWDLWRVTMNGVVGKGNRSARLEGRTYNIEWCHCVICAETVTIEL